MCRIHFVPFPRGQTPQNPEMDVPHAFEDLDVVELNKKSFEARGRKYILLGKYQHVRSWVPKWSSS